MNAAPQDSTAEFGRGLGHCPRSFRRDRGALSKEHRAAVSAGAWVLVLAGPKVSGLIRPPGYAVVSARFTQCRLIGLQKC